jgi:hypothetical protein
MSLKTENSRRVAKSRPVCMGLKDGKTLNTIRTVRTNCEMALRIVRFVNMIVSCRQYWTCMDFQG